jgi:membrane protease YdiL (CAAX protease family)
MFLPAIPAYIWLWPNVHGTALWVAQLLVYGYVLAGTLFIGLRRWNWGELGLNRSGFWLSLTCGMVLLAGRWMVVRSVAWGGRPTQYSLLALAGQTLYYIAVVGLVEELLFRGLVYRAFEEWLNVRWAIWGSSIGFMLWHVFGQGLLIGAATFLIGLIFALFRWRAGGIVGLIALHGLWDLQGVLLVADSNDQVLSWGRPEIQYPALMWVGLALMVGVPIYLWKIYPKVAARLHFSQT